LGKYNPAGRLPITFYRSVDQLPDFEDYAMKGRTYRYFQGTPLFAFGYGLSYTQFAYQSAQLDKDTISYGEQVALTIPVQNVGKRAGEEVVQVYLRRPGDADGPIKSLRGFQRIALQPGETKACTITLPYENFEWFDEQTGTMHPMEGTYELLYGSSSREQDLKKIMIEVK
jgi:beta-glucosidase